MVHILGFIVVQQLPDFLYSLHLGGGADDSVKRVVCSAVWMTVKGVKNWQRWIALEINGDQVNGARQATSKSVNGKIILNIIL